MGEGEVQVDAQLVVRNLLAQLSDAHLRVAQQDALISQLLEDRQPSDPAGDGG